MRTGCNLEVDFVTDKISGSMPRPDSEVCEANAPKASQASEEETKLTAFCATWIAMFSGCKTPCKEDAMKFQ